MTTAFHHRLDTGSGRTRVTLLFFDDDTALIEFDSMWMSSGSRRYRFHWKHQPQSASYGILTLREIDRYTSQPAAAWVPENLIELVGLPDGPEYRDGSPYHDIVFEYIRLPHSQHWMADAPDLEEMRGFFGLADWPNTFDLLLWMHFSVPMIEGKLRETELEGVLNQLDKLKFAAVPMGAAETLRV